MALERAALGPLSSEDRAALLGRLNEIEKSQSPVKSRGRSLKRLISCAGASNLYAKGSP
jgi:hypothetical protein